MSLKCSEQELQSALDAEAKAHAQLHAELRANIRHCQKLQSEGRTAMLLGLLAELKQTSSSTALTPNDMLAKLRVIERRANEVALSSESMKIDK